MRGPHRSPGYRNHFGSNPWKNRRASEGKAAIPETNGSLHVSGMSVRPVPQSRKTNSSRSRVLLVVCPRFALTGGLSWCMAAAMMWLTDGGGRSGVTRTTARRNANDRSGVTRTTARRNANDGNDGGDGVDDPSSSLPLTAPPFMVWDAPATEQRMVTLVFF